MPEKQRLLCRWTFELAAFLQEEHNMDKKRALELAHLNRELLTHWAVGACGLSIGRRTAHYARHRARCVTASRRSSTNMSVRTTSLRIASWPTETFTYWDLEKEGFRTFKASNLIKIKAATIVNCMHRS